MRPASFSDAPPRTFLAIGLCVLLGACSKPVKKTAGPEERTDPAPTLRISQSRKATTPRSRRQPTASDELLNPDLTTEAVALLVEWSQTEDADRRGEIAVALAENGSPAARTALEEIYTESSALEDKLVVVRSLSSLNFDEPQPTVRLLDDALAPSQPAELRAAAIQALGELNDPRTLPLWRALATDEEEAIRDGATAMIEYLEGIPAGPEIGR